MKIINFVPLMAILFYSCGGGTPSNSSSNEEVLSDGNVEYTGNDGMTDTRDAEMSQQMYLCPMCQGNCRIQHYYSGELIDCPACMGAGKVNAETIKQLQDAAQMGEDLANGVINGGGTSVEHIEAEIARHEENIAQLEYQLEYIEGSINVTQIEQQIIEEKYEIKRLIAILKGM